MLPVQQHDVKILSLRDTPQIIKLSLGVDALMKRSNLAHQTIAVAWQTFERRAQHPWRLVSLCRLEEADAVVVRIMHQARELLLPQGGLHCTAVRPGSKCQPR